MNEKPLNGKSSLPALAALDQLERVEQQREQLARCTDVTVVLDSSGSMATHREATIDGFNGYIKALRAEVPGARLSLMPFDSDERGTPRLAFRYSDKPIDSVPLLSRQSYVPDGGTPLYDAVGRAIETAEERNDRPGTRARVIIVVQTDGHEGGSERYTQSALQRRIAEKQAAGWLFVFLGAGIDAIRGGGALGILPAHSLTYSGRKSNEAFTALSAVTKGYASVGDAKRVGFSAEQRAASIGQLGSGTRSSSGTRS